MVFNDLKQLDGQMVQYYEVCGNKVTPKTAQVRYSRYNNYIVLRQFDKLGRYTNYNIYIHLSEFISPSGIRTITSGRSTKLVGESSMIRANSGFGIGNRDIYLQKEDAYNRIINKLREERRNVDKKMLAIQKELYQK